MDPESNLSIRTLRNMQGARKQEARHRATDASSETHGAADDASLVGEMVIAYFHGIPAGAKQLRHQSGLGELTGLYPTLGSAARGLRHGGLSNDIARQCGTAVGAVDRQGSDGREALFGCQAGYKWKACHGRLNRLR